MYERTGKGDAGVRGAPSSTLVFSEAAPEGNPAIFRHTTLQVTAPSKKATNSHVTNKSTTAIPGTQMTVPKAMRWSTHLNHAFEPFPYSKAKANATPQALIRQTLLKPLTPSDMLRSGYIYVFWHPGSMGYIKIGYTQNIKKRLEDWHKQCGFNLERHKSLESMNVTKVQHLDRVEELIHAELKEYRGFEPCCSGCGRKHLEWFQVDPSYALRVVAKWTRRSLYSNGELDVSQEEIEKLCQLTEADRPLPPPKKGAKNFNGSIRGGRRASKA
ncbi:uncharacterized protein Z519_05374 [Cladophialophora bantiana CBS 173.52]|uniref:Bacteriophage T5 Orf172 DNA-binding domain-containing protein n=1 Tax=Cladophialophora bantiana (strain ATCC 10958 / CBS 173.52 / CDC B-1940 / NIH 8579) TaxID=1442370 RepID=A0A0D2HLA9_CLAB1|nr:uncharacterized protein Z519_05374 [Cladophialophora bantiana CBS 173.52]KIW94058.1 hypothetical protein Z519_05374 [Cladophialophora bantiana CBS 173.52]